MIRILLCIGFLFWGCAGSHMLMRSSGQPWTYEEALQRYLDRRAGWESFTARVKLKIEIGDTTFTAKGSLIYAQGEKYHLSFVRPYNQVIGDFYITPKNIIYWGNNQSRLLFTADDTVRLDELIPIGLPAWNPRDLLPLPLSGRSSGLQVLKVENDSSHESRITAEARDTQYEIDLRLSDGVIRKETVSRPGMQPVIKEYKRTYSLDGWPVPARVTCTDTTGRIRLTWKLSRFEMRAPPYIRDPGMNTESVESPKP